MTGNASQTQVNTQSEDYKKSAAMWQLPRTLMGGTKAMRAAGVLYLPQEQAESPDAYRARLMRSTLFNAFRKTVKDMTGKVFRKEITIEKDVPPDLVKMAENIDGAGRHLNVFARDAFFDAMQTGIGFIFADMPPALQAGTGRNGEVTRADEQKRRPYLCFVKAECLIGWKVETIDGQPVLTQARIMECVEVADGEFGTKKVPQVRVLYVGRFELWQEIVEGPDKGKWAKVGGGNTIGGNGKPLSYIPLAPVYINRTGFMQAEPPLEDLADLNVAHWQMQSDLRNINHVACVPILVMTGWGEDDKIEIGASSAIRTNNPNAKVEYCEHSGAALGTSKELLKEIEFQMQTQGLQLLVPQPGGKTATGEVHDDEKENSPLAMMARSLEDAIEAGLGFLADFAGLGRDKGGSVTVNKDFGITAAAAADVPNILAAYREGTYDRETALRELQRRGFLSDGADVEVIMLRAEAEAAKRDAALADAGGTGFGQ
jgi:hypothetical protein